MTACPRCGGENTVSNGSVKGVKKRLCRDCSFQFTRSEPFGKPLSVKLFAVSLYLHGVQMSAIAKWFGVSPPALLKWIRKYAGIHYPNPSPGEVQVVELDELRHILTKVTSRSRSGKIIVVIEGGSLTANTGIVIKLLNNS